MQTPCRSCVEWVPPRHDHSRTDPVGARTDPRGFDPLGHRPRARRRGRDPLDRRFGGARDRRQAPLLLEPARQNGRCGGRYPFPDRPGRELMAPDDHPRTLKAMLSEAKDTSELMVDLAYAALFFGDARMANEVQALEERLEDLAHKMREVCVLAARSPRDAEEMSSVLHVLSAIERMGNAAVDIARIVTHRLGIPAALVADLAAAEEVSHRVRVRAESLLAHRSLADACLPTEVGMRVVAIRRGNDWLFDPDGDEMLLDGDVL